MGVQHVGLFVKSVRDVGETYDLVKKRNLQMMMKLGQHTQDPHMSFYHFNPSGFAFETHRRARAVASRRLRSQPGVAEHVGSRARRADSRAERAHA